MIARLSSAALFLAVALFLGGGTRASANSSIFQGKPVAQSAINFDGSGFLINGQRVFVASAGMEYARVPRALWADRLLRIKREGFNCVEIYVMWNYHETQSGQFNFTDNRDLDAYLKLANSLGLYAIVRVGPYVCAEWDSGGYPLWLRFVANLEVRNNNPVFQTYVVRWFNQLLPIVVNNQIDRGGNVIMVQLENEDYAGWGTDGVTGANTYYQYLQSTALNAGLEVPYFFSGLHHEDTTGGNPFNRSDMQSPPSPWFSTEFYTGWITQYGSRALPGAADRNGTPITPAMEVRNTWQIVAYGGNGYNHYMALGGSNFDYWNNDEVGSSYDYGAAIGEAGDVRPEYFRFRKAAWFARSFQTVLENSTDATSTYSGAATNTSVALTARTGTAGTILFLDDAGTSTLQTSVKVGGITYPKAGALTLNSKEILPIVTNYSLGSGVTLNVAPTRIYGVTQQGNTTTLVIYGQAGSPAELYFTVPTGTTLGAGAASMTLGNGTALSLQATFPSSGAVDYSFQFGNQSVRVLAVNDVWVDNTWFVDAGGRNFVVVGPQYVGATSLVNGYLQAVMETPYQNATANPVTVYGPGDNPVAMTAQTTPGAHPSNATLTPWQTLSGIQQAAPTYDTTGWLASTTGPQQMGADGDISAYAWYRATANVTSAQSCVFAVQNMADRMTPFVDGVAVPAANITGTNFSATLGAGNHTIAVATVHQGRDKFLGYSGPITQSNPKGISGPSSLLVGAAQSAQSTTVYGPMSVTGWRVMPPTTQNPGTTVPTLTTANSTAYTIGTDAFAGAAGYAWFQTTLPTVSASASDIVAKFARVDDNGTVYLNGTLITSHQGFGTAFAADFTGVWSATGPNVLSVLVQNTANAGGIYTGVTLTGYSGAVPITTWISMTTTSAAVGTAPPAATAAGWINYTVGNDAFGGATGYAWFQATLPPAPSGLNGEYLNFASVDDDCWVYLNGTLLTTHSGWSVPFLVDVSRAWNTGGANVLSLLVHNGDGPGGLDKAVLFSTCQSSVPLTNWAQQGGPGNPNATTGWQPLGSSATFSGPQFFSTTFTAAPPAGDGTNPMWRVVTPASGNGSVWVNGHNLGRYPQIVKTVPGEYLPECWLNSGPNANTLVIYDFAGTRPDSVQVFADPAAGRDVTTFLSATNSFPPPPISIDQWRQNYFGANASNAAIGGNLADPDGDGLNNLLEYALGTNPLTSNTNPAVMDKEAVGGNTYLRLTVTKSPTAMGLTYSVEATGDLTTPGSWSSSGVVVETNSATTLTARDSVPLGGSTTAGRFLRLRVTTQ